MARYIHDKLFVCSTLTVQDMAKVEGIDYFDRFNDRTCECWYRYTMQPGPYSVTDAIKWLMGLECSQEMLEVASFTIYGNGGQNRWYLYGTGEIVFSCHHASEAAKKEAERLGFRLV